MASLARVGSWGLDYLDLRHLKPNREFLSRAEEETDRICEFLETRCFHDAPWAGVQVLKVVKGGSLGKGTSMKNGKTDLELFSDIFNLYRDQEKNWKEVTEAIARWVNKWKGSRSSHAIKIMMLVIKNIRKPEEKKLKTSIEEMERRIKEWQKQPYMSGADLELLSNIFQSFNTQERHWKLIDTIAKEFSRFPATRTDGIVDLIKSYTDKEKGWKKVIKKTKRQVNNRQVKPYLSDADLVLFLNIFKSYTDQEMHRKMIIEEIERRLEEWQQEPYLSEVDVGLLLDLLKSYGDQEKDPKEIPRKIRTWLCECQKQLYLSEAERGLFNDLIERYTDKEKEQKGTIKEIARWRSEDQAQPYLSEADLGLLLDLIKRYRDHSKNQCLITEEIAVLVRSNQRLMKRKAHLNLRLINQRAHLNLLLDLLLSYREQEKDPKEFARKIEMWLCECQEQLYVPEADLASFRNLLERFLEEEKYRRMVTEEIARWRNESPWEPYLSSADLVLLLNLMKRYTDKEEESKRIFEEIERWFSDCKEKAHLELIFEKSKWSNPRVLQFKLRSKKTDEFIDFDVLPAYDALGRYDGSMPNPQVYIDLIHTDKPGEFSPCFTELQKDFIVGRRARLKSLIRLVKHWYNELQEKSLPPKYALELLTVYAWEQGSGQTVFNTAEGFRTVLWLIEHYKEIRIYWTKYYDFHNETIKQYLQVQLCKNRPVILDPADPTANFGEAEGWIRLAEKAKSYASMKCCQKRDGSLVEPWNVPLAKEVPWEEGGSYCTL